MHDEEWSAERVVAVLARLGDAGYPQPKMARLAKVSQSTVNRWSRGEVQPRYPAVRKLAVAVWPQFPDLARELVEAAGYPWAEPSEAERPPALSPETQARMRADVGDELASALIAHYEHLVSGRTAPAGAALPRESGATGRRKAG